MNLTVIKTSYGSYTTHEASCPIIEGDWNRHGVTEWTGIEANSVADLAKEIQLVQEIPQSLAIVTQRIICHHCAMNLEGSGIKRR
jgi:hypothetical protein